MTTEPYDESVRDAVARETARRKHVFMAFLALLLVPIAIGAYALTKTHTEIEQVAADVTPIVTSRVAGDITARVATDVATRTEPLIRENVVREITAAVEPRLSSVTKDITQLQTSVQKTSELVRSVTPQLAAVPELSNRLLAFNTSQGRQGRELASIRLAASSSLETANTNKEALAELTQQMAAINRELKSLQVRVKALENPPR